jgi:hypothetical protein
VHRRALVFALFFFTALILYLAFQSIGLDDFDSFSFVLALTHYDIQLQQPHPPGFPVYIALGRLVQTVISDPQSALTMISAICGAVAMAALAWIGAQLFSLRAGILAALWMMVLPGFWLTSEIALSDVPGVAFVLLTGLSLGLRPQNGLPLAIFALYILWRLRDPKRAALFAVVAFAAALLWLVPVVAISGGLDKYLDLVRAHSSHVLGVDSLIGNSIGGRIEMFLQGIAALFGGNALAIMIAAIIFAIGFARVYWRSEAALLCLVWFVIVTLQVFLLESLERPRLYLPIFAPLVLLAASGWSSIRSRWLRTIPVALVLIMMISALPLVAKLTQELPPPQQATSYISAHFPADQTLIVSQGSFRAAQVNLATYPQLYLGQFDALQWSQNIAARQPRYLVLLDRDDVWPEAYAAVTEAESYVPIEDHLFSRDSRVFPQHSLVRMQVLTPLRLLTPDQLAPPENGMIQVGTMGKYFGEGWYRAEDVAGSLVRWTQQLAVIRVALPPVDTVLILEGTSFPENQTVEVTVNRKLIGSLAITGVWQPVEIAIPANVISENPISVIELRHARAEVPPGSNRILAVAYRVIEFRPAQ